MLDSADFRKIVSGKIVWENSSHISISAKELSHFSSKIDTDSIIAVGKLICSSGEIRSFGMFPEFRCFVVGIRDVDRIMNNLSFKISKAQRQVDRVFRCKMSGEAREASCLNEQELIVDLLP